MLRFLFVEIVSCVSTIIEIGFLVLDRKVQSLYFTYIACAGERLLLLKVECRERSGRNNGPDLAIEVRSLSMVIVVVNHYQLRVHVSLTFLPVP